MDLEKLRSDLREAWSKSGMSQPEFAGAHGLKAFQFNKFINGGIANPRLSTVREYERAWESVRAMKRK